ncbi:retrotransposon protein, putative, ty1-copia subclass [Tanacetum coccineum]
MIDEPVVKEKQSSLDDTSIPNVQNIGLRSYPPLPTHGSTLAGNTPRMSSYANVTGVPSRKDLNFRTLFTPGGNGVDVVVLVQSIRAISDRFTNTAYGFFLGKRVAYPVVAKWEPGCAIVQEDVESVSVWVKLHGVPVTVFSEDGLSAIATKLGTPLMLDSYYDMCFQSWGKSSHARAMIELRADVELKDTIMVAMLKLTGKGFYTCTAPKGAPVGPKVGFKLTKEYRPASKKPTANTSGTKKIGVEPTKEVSNSNPFYVLNSVENDRELGTNGETSNLASNGANSTTLMDDAGKPLKKVEYSDDHDSENERDSYENGNYDEDPYDDDVCEGQDIPNKIQDIGDNLDIGVRGRNKK